MRPKAIIFFEILIFTSLALGIVHSLIVPNAQLQQAPLGFVLLVQGGVVAIMVTLTLLTSRRRSNIAKWISIALYLLGLPLFFKMISDGSIEITIVQVIQTIMQTIAFALLFVPSARNWFNEK
jgi:hypothetical protein